MSTPPLEAYAGVLEWTNIHSVVSVKKVLISSGIRLPQSGWVLNNMFTLTELEEKKYWHWSLLLPDEMQKAEYVERNFCLDEQGFNQITKEEPFSIEEKYVVFSKRRQKIALLNEIDRVEQVLGNSSLFSTLIAPSSKRKFENNENEFVYKKLKGELMNTPQKRNLIDSEECIVKKKRTN